MEQPAENATLFAIQTDKHKMLGQEYVSDLKKEP